MSEFKLSAKDFVNSIIMPAICSSRNSEYEHDKNEVFIDDEISKIKHQYINEIMIKKNFFYELKPKSSFRKIQDELNKNFLNKIPVNLSSKAYRAGMCYLDFLEPHTKSFKFLRLDIKNCFHSIKVSHLRDCFSSYFLDQKLTVDSKQFIVDGFINLVTFELDESFDNKSLVGRRIIPIGFPTSPNIVNILLRKIDIQIEKLCSKYHVTYTRYADDLLFSESKDGRAIDTDFFINEIQLILGSLDLKLNKKKTIFKRHTISLNGFVIQSHLGKNYNAPFKINNISDYSGIRISNKKIQCVKTAIKLIKDGVKSNSEILKISFGHNHDRIGNEFFGSKSFANKYAKNQLSNKLSGYRSFLISLLIFNDKFQCTPEIITNKYRGMINDIDVVIILLQ
jgi:RNA-directed DNA polymerase